MYSDNFKKFVTQGINKYFVGTGNPNADILFIGKESAIKFEEIEGRSWYLNNALDWQHHIENGTCETLEYFVDETHKLRKDWGKNTWSKYQKLSDYIFNRKNEKYKIDFLKNVFTTEINDAPDQNTSTADKSGLNDRKTLLKQSEFIQSFPIVVLACSNYIQNNDNVREIDNIFNVSFDGPETGKYWYSKGNWFFVHHNSDKTKLVIHTRQLSADVKDDLLKDMGKVISEHLSKIKLIKSTKR